jgi:hypothetical protein
VPIFIGELKVFYISGDLPSEPAKALKEMKGSEDSEVETRHGPDEGSQHDHERTWQQDS